MSKSCLILLAIILMCSCHSISDSELGIGKHHLPDDALALELDVPMTAEPPPPSEPQGDSEYSLDQGSKIIKHGAMKFEVDKLQDAKRKVDMILSECGGYFENEQFHSYGNRISYALMLRIPHSKFDSLTKALENDIGRLTSKNISAKDVTEEYVDLKVRLDNNLAYLDQYKSILQKAKSVKEIMEVQEKIRRIEEEIESKKGRIIYLDDRVKFSTLHLEINELIIHEISNTPNFGRRVLNAFNNGCYAFLSFIVALVNLWPFLLLCVLIFVGRKPMLHLFGNRRKQPRNQEV